MDSHGPYPFLFIFDLKGSKRHDIYQSKVYVLAVVILFQALSLFFLLTLESVAIDLAFVKVFRSDGSLVQLEKDGKYAHVAIKTPRGWLHADPLRGVVIDKSLSQMTFEHFSVDIYSDESKNFPDQAFIDYFLGRPYDSTYSWSDEKIYCSELVAKFFGFEPTPMSFEADAWTSLRDVSRGDLGISPDEVYQKVLGLGFTRRSCDHFF